MLPRLLQPSSTSFLIASSVANAELGQVLFSVHQKHDSKMNFATADLKGSILTFSEFRTRTGRVDFYIPTKNWGVELLRDDNWLEQRSARFSPTGKYGALLCLSNYIVLDCCVNNPRLPHPCRPTSFHCPSFRNAENFHLNQTLCSVIISRMFAFLTIW